LISLVFVLDKRYREYRRGIKIENIEKLATWGAQDTRRRQTKQKYRTIMYA